MKVLGRFTLSALLVFSSFLFGGCNSGGGGGSDPVDADLRIGALLDLSGDASGSDQYVEQVILQAQEDAKALGVVLGIEVRDTAGNPQQAAQQMQALIDSGVKVFVGPSSSSQAQAVLPVANAAGALVVSESSTAQSLAIPNDALYRMCPTSYVEAQATSDLIRSQGLRAIVTVNRADVGNTELVTALRPKLSAAGIALQPPIVYPTSHGSDFSDVAQALGAAVDAAGGPSSGVGVYVAGFDEVADLLADANGVPSLQGVPFFGSDGVSQNPDIVTSAGPAFFSADADGVPSPNLGIPANKLPDAQRIMSGTGQTMPDGFALAAYDAVMIMANAFIADPSFGSGGTQSRKAFVQAANGYSGVTGVVQLNAAGDRASAAYTFWGVCYVNGLHNWYDVGSWTPASPSSTNGVASWRGCPVS
jgi:branched-chain amino acid transport system substrate-binding protein